MGNQIGGTVYLRKNGKLLTLGDGEVTCNAGKPKREAVMASDGAAGYSSKPQVPSISGDLIFTRDLDVSSVMDSEDETITADLANGQTFVLVNAWWAGEGDTTSDGKIKFKFEGMRGEYVKGK